MSLATIAKTYYDQGFNPVPLAAGTKIPVRKGVTGGSKKNLSVASISKIEDGLNLGLRLPVGVIGIDWDAYKGAEGFENLIVLLGELPETFRSTSRSDGKSGIYLYKTTATNLPGGIADANVDIIKHTHRVAACYPSIHTSGEQYNWYFGNTKVDVIPSVAGLPELPASWVQFLTKMTEIRKDKQGMSYGGNKLASFSGRVAEFANASEGDRNTLLFQLARDGMWYELGGKLEDGQSFDMILEAAYTNGLVSDESESVITYRINFQRTWAEKHFDETKVGNPDAASFDKKAMIDWNNSVQASALSDELKFAANVLASFAIEKSYGYVIMSTRALAEVTGVSAMTASRYMKKLADKGWIKLTSGQGYNKEGKTLRSNTINFLFENVVESEEAPRVGDVAEILQGYFDLNKTEEIISSNDVLTLAEVDDKMNEETETQSKSYEAQSPLAKLIRNRMKV